MFEFRKVLVIGSMVILTGCAQHNTAYTSTMGGAEPVAEKPGSATLSADEKRLVEQAAALDEMSREIVRKSTLRGAGMGAAAGCGLALVSASAAGRCLGGAVIGGSIGGLAGHAAGRKQVANRMQLVSGDDAMQAISRASARVGSLTPRLHILLDAQDRELAQLRHDVEAGLASQSALDTRVRAVKESRAALARALVLSARRAAQARKLLRDARNQGQTGLTWHIDAVQELEIEALSARSAIRLI